MGKTRDITVLVGIPASGKSTWCIKYVQNNPNYVRINRDSYRMMLKQSQQLDHKGETLVTELVRQAVISSVNMGYNVIVDSTNLNRKYLDSDIEFYRKYGNIKFRIFDISLDKAIERDATREATVGDKVIRKMWDQYRSLIDSGYDLYSTREKYPRIEKDIIWDNSNLDKEDAVIFDLDGTLTHNNNKRGYFDWDKVDVDDLDEIIREVLYSFNECNYKILLVTGRDAAAENSTIRWLIKHQIDYDALYMRPKNDFRKDTVVKKEIYEQHIKDNYNVLCVFDDRTKVVNMWRELGLKCLQVINGDY